MKILITLLALVGIVFAFFSTQGKNKHTSSKDTVLSLPIGSTKAPDSVLPENTISGENEFYNPRVVAESAWHLMEKFEIEDPLVRNEIYYELFYRLDDEDDFASMMIGLVQAGIDVEQVLSYAAILQYDGFDTVYGTVRDILTEDQRKIFLEEYARSAALNQDEFIPLSLQDDMKTYEIQIDQEFFFNSIVLLEGEGVNEHHRNDPKVFEVFSQIPQTEVRGELITWWYALRKLYQGGSEEIELTEKLRYSQTGSYDWLINMSIEELENEHLDYIFEKQL